MEWAWAFRFRDQSLRHMGVVYGRYRAIALAQSFASFCPAKYRALLRAPRRMEKCRFQGLWPGIPIERDRVPPHNLAFGWCGLDRNPVTLTLQSHWYRTRHLLEIQGVSLDWKRLFVCPSQGVKSVNQLVVPAGVPIQFSTTSCACLRRADRPFADDRFAPDHGQFETQHDAHRSDHADAALRAEFSVSAYCLAAMTRGTGTEKARTGKTTAGVANRR
jgi:hypothetical protein